MAKKDDDVKDPDKAQRGRVLIERSRKAPDRLYDVYEPADGVQEVYVDGNTQLIMGPLLTKLGMFSTFAITETPDGLIEKRELLLRLVMPTHVLLDLCSGILGTISANQNKLIAGLDTQRTKILSLTRSPPSGPELIDKKPTT